MTPEQKAAIAAAGAAEKGEPAPAAEPANANDPAPEPIEGEEPAEATDPEPSTPDYEAIAKAERERADAAERALAANAFKGRQSRRAAADPDEGEDEDADAPLTRAEFETRLASERQTIEKQALTAAALSIARANTATEAEAQAAMQYYLSRVIPTGNLEEDVLFAIGGLNYRRSAARVGEIARANRAQATARRTTGEPHRETAPASEPKISPADAQAMKQSGMIWDGVARLYKKPLGGSKHLFYDPKTKRRWTA